MFANLAFMDDFARIRVEELRREAENDRLVDQALGPNRSIRSRVAIWLVAIAERIEDRPRAAIARAEA
jgi:hypothetical protein